MQRSFVLLRMYSLIELRTYSYIKNSQITTVLGVSNLKVQEIVTRERKFL